MNVPMSVVLYGASICAESIKLRYRRKEIETFQRRAELRCVSAHRTVSTDAVNFPLSFSLESGKRCFQCNEDSKEESCSIVAQTGGQAPPAAEMERLIRKFVERRMDHVIIRNLDKWMNRKHSLLNFHLTQVMNDHECFDRYLQEPELKTTPAYSHCV